MSSSRSTARGRVSASILLTAVLLGAAAPGVVAAQTESSVFISQVVPAVMSAGQQYQVSVTMRNTGTTTWTGAAYRLGSQNPHENTNWGGSRVTLPGDVPPGQDAVVAWTVTAPANAGVYNFQWRMLHVGVQWFGQWSANVAVTVEGSAPVANDAVYVAQSVPAVMNVGQQYQVSVTMRNTGSNTWSPGSYRLGAQTPHDNSNWGSSRVVLPSNVAPGQQLVVAWTVTAPPGAGIYNFQWRLLNLGVEWFGERSLNVAVHVQGGPALVNASAYVAQTIPTVMTAGRRYPVSVRMRNTGTTTWTSGGYQLGAQNPHDNANWGTGRVPLDASVAPGAEKTIAWMVTAPTQVGTYDFQWRLLQLGLEWFGARSANARVRVVAPRATSPYALRFRGQGIAAPGLDRVVVPLDDPATEEPGPPVDVGAADFTIEMWMKPDVAGNNAAAVTCGANVDWISGNIVLDRDRFGQDRKFGLSLAAGRLVFGVSGDGTGDRTICATTSLLDDQWHHVAVQRRRSDGRLSIYVDGALEAEEDGPDGDVSYPDDAVPCADCCGGSSCNGSDPFLVFGAEKHDAGAAFPSYAGLLDEVRISVSLRYAGASFPVPAAPFLADAGTAALYHFDEGNGDDIVDDSATIGGASPGSRRYGGAAAGPDWVTDTPFPTTPAASVPLVAAGVGQTVALAHAGDHRLFLADRTGVIRIYDGVQVLPVPFLDIDPLVGSVGAEQGLLGLVFHPNYVENGLFFVDYIDDAGDTVIARYRRSANDPNRADAASAAVLLQIDQPFSNHNGGQLQFGPDGYLYASSGDGGSGGDPSCNAQRGDNLLGKILRLDVDQNVAAPPFHGIPADNPFVGAGDPRDEIWSLGLRNPWRFTFDRLTRAMFIGDVGQGAYEEIDYQHPDSAGGDNYGWKILEGPVCFSTTACPAGTPSCADPSLEAPILFYDHSSGCSVTGGYVVRSPARPALYGSYVFADYCGGSIWAARQNEGEWTSAVVATTGNVATFGEDSGGDVFLGVNSALYRLE